MRRRGAWLARRRAIGARRGERPLRGVLVDGPAAALARAVADAVSARAAVLASPSAPDPVVATGPVDVRPTGAPRPLWPLAGGLLGALAGVALLVRRRRRALRVWTPSDLDGAAGVPVVQLVPRGSEAVDQVAAAAGAASRPVIGVGSATSREESVATVLELARGLIDAGIRVVLVDGDVRNGTLSRAFGPGPATGFEDALAGRVGVRAAVRPWVSEGRPMAVVPAGLVPARPTALLLSTPIDALLEPLSEETDVVLVHLPPFREGPDGLLMAARVGTVVLATRSGETLLHDVEAVAGMLQAAGAPIGTAVLLPREGRAPRLHLPLVERLRAAQGPRRTGPPTAGPGRAEGDVALGPPRPTAPDIGGAPPAPVLQPLDWGAIGLQALTGAPWDPDALIPAAGGGRLEVGGGR